MTYFNIIILILVFVLILFLFITGMGGGGGVQEYYDFFFPSSSPDSLSSISSENTIKFDLSINTVYTPTGTRVSETYSHYMYKVYSITIDKNYSYNVLKLVLESHNDVRLPDTFRFEFQNNKTNPLVVKTDFENQIEIRPGGSGSCVYNSETKDMECAASLRLNKY